MADNNPQNLDLEQILATLANLPNTQNHPAEVSQQVYNPGQILGFPDNQQAIYTPEQPNGYYALNQPQDPRQYGQPSPSPIPQPAPQQRVSTPIINPATITEWKHGLRCVNKVAAQNPDFSNAVRKLMKDQERNMKDWEAGRQRLIDEQKAKRENEKTQRAALPSGILGNSTPLRTPEREKEELSEYDLKVYRACRLMVDSQSANLKGLGVPFFGTKQELILADGASPEDDEAGQDKKVTKKQLLELQRKMLNHLEDLYGD
ncbi:hypothetical protein CC80DRAFT_533152 [Byssothecium circinans]|uniref:Uncharacterized protein n=1 Tax=Byssothecium circinans TaxID=147558 RepID=A0A6A5UAC8_9PLEO|nr:hypothetical protein CC80DRAFT_533152 [Byssothecium circinans]